MDTGLTTIAEADILAHADAEDADGDGISGRPNQVWDVESSSNRLGRFGWKANQPSLLQQNAGAFLGDIGITSELFDSQNRGTEPLLRERTFDAFRPVAWDEALDYTAAELKRIQALYGRDSVAVVSTGQILTEEFYTLGKLVRGLIGTNNYDGNTTLCMASAVSGYKRSFGSDGPPGCYDDFDHTECLLAVGSNLPEQHPIIYWRLKMALEQRKFPVIVVDPRVTMFAQMADVHLPVTPGTDLVLLNALAHVILDEGLEDRAYIEAHTNGFEEFAALVERYYPTTAAGVCGIDEDTIRNVARLYGKAGRAMAIDRAAKAKRARMGSLLMLPLRTGRKRGKQEGSCGGAVRPHFLYGLPSNHRLLASRPEQGSVSCNNVQLL